jgi:hypothetical protein
MNKGPCPLDCPGRNEHCHATCKTYLAAYEENLKRYERKLKEFALSEVIAVGIKKRMQAMKKKQKQV